MIAIGEQFGLSGRYGYAWKFPDQSRKQTQLEVLLPANQQVKGKLQDAAGQPIANQKVARHIGGPSCILMVSQQRMLKGTLKYSWKFGRSQTVVIGGLSIK